ncbi:MAG TPA: PRTRC system protein E [Bryobacteraceae bacterium]|nr:PRTRC system protein E [Bryobacteraceae bacterium]
MFTELAPVLKDRAITITLAAEGDGIRVNVIPHLKKKGDDDKKETEESSVLTAAFTVTGTAEELDAELGGLLTSFVAQRATAATSLASLEARLTAERKLIEDEASKLTKDAQKKLDEAKKKKTEADKKAGVKPVPETANLFGGDGDKEDEKEDES